MTKAKELLLEWAINFVKSKNAFIGTLQNFEKCKDFDAKAVYSDKEEYILAEPTIKDIDKLISALPKDKNVLLFVLNSFDNFNSVVENWKRFADLENLTIYFVNMFSHTEKKWAIKPKVHDLISDSKSLKSGLNSMFMMVEPVREQDLEGKHL